MDGILAWLQKQQGVSSAVDGAESRSGAPPVPDRCSVAPPVREAASGSGAPPSVLGKATLAGVCQDAPAPLPIPDVVPDVDWPRVVSDVDWRPTPKKMPLHRYKNWVKHINHEVGDVRCQRGKQLRDVRMASICTGTSPNTKINKLFEIPTREIFHVEKKVWALHFVEDNFPNDMPEHIYLDLKTLMEQGKCNCNRCGRECYLNTAKKYLDVLVGGISCKSYSWARTGRGASWANHSDVWMVDAFLLMLVNLEPLKAILENVFGFLKVDRATRKAPIHCLARRIKHLCLDSKYWIRVFLSRGQDFGIASRNRIWIMFVHKHGEDPTCMQRITRYHTGIVQYRRSQPRLVPSAIFLQESDIRIMDMLAGAAGKVYMQRGNAGNAAKASGSKGFLQDAMQVYACSTAWVVTENRIYKHGGRRA